MNLNFLDESNNNLRILNILVIYTGGTIGMKKNANGAYVPVKNAFIERIKSYPELHNQILYEQLIKLGILNLEENSLVIPNIRNKRIAHYKIEEYSPLLDSSNMSAEDWIRIAKDINKYYAYYNSFVILHGTDTLTYTASALSFLLQHLDKPVIVTGSQISIFETNSDAVTNFLNSLIFACVDNIKEVCVCFANKLMRGNRTIKSSSTELDAFSSPNYQNLGQVQIHLKVYNALLLIPQNDDASTKLKLNFNLERNVRELRLTPMMTLNTIKESLSPPTKGIVLVSYGYGNIPINMEGLLDTLELAVKTNDILIVNVTQCNQGTIGNAYATSQVQTFKDLLYRSCIAQALLSNLGKLEEIGVIPGHDMTTVTALVKLSYVLGRTDWTKDQKIEAMRNNLRGEMTLPEDT